MRAASTPCTVGEYGVRSALAPAGTAALAAEHPSSANVCTTSSMKNGVPSVFVQNELLEAGGATVPVTSPLVAQQKGQEILPLPLCQWREPELGVIRLLPPLLAIFRPIVHQQQNPGTGHTLTQGIEKSLRLTVDPMQVFKDQDQRLIETLTQEQPLERLERPPPANLRVHLLQRRGLFFDARAAQTDTATCLRGYDPG